ncbi:MAG: single-stranded DNA-binding protein [Dysgonamonadaceae bacterium]
MSVNKVILIGNVGKDPEVRYYDNGSAVANFPLATTERGYTATNGTQIPDRTEWHNVVCWRGLAKIVEQYVKKGTPIYIEGKLRTRNYDDNQGIKRYVTEIYADNLELLGRRSSDENSTQATSAAVPKTEMPTGSPAQASTPGEEDDLPF